MERIEYEKHDIELEKIEAAEKQRKEEREAAERHDQLLYEMEKAKLVLEQDRTNSQQFQQQPIMNLNASYRTGSMKMS